MKTLLRLILLLAVTLIANSAQAEMFTDANVTSNVIFGSGNINGGFTVDRTNNVELGLRAKLRFNEFGQPENTFNSNGDGSYTFQSGLPPVGSSGWAVGNPSAATWNFEWSINTDYTGTTGVNLADLTYLLEIDHDPAAGAEDFLAFNPINPVGGFPQPGTGGLYPDHSIGDNSTAQSAGMEATDLTNYNALIGANNLAQNSWNMAFFSPEFSFDSRINGEYMIRLHAFDSNDALLATTSITVNVVPEPSTYAGLLGIASISLLAYGWRRKQQQAA